MQVRLLTEADADAHRQLRITSIEESPVFSCPGIVSELAIYALHGGGALTRHDRIGGCVWGAFDGHRLVGVVAATRQLQHGNAPELHLWGLYVRPEYRGKAVAASLMQTALHWGGSQPGVAVAVVHVPRRNHRALRWFARSGFETVDDTALRSTQLQAMRYRYAMDKRLSGSDCRHGMIASH